MKRLPELEDHVPLARLTSIGTGGPARYLARPRDDEELGRALAFAWARGLRVATIGLGSNLLAADTGFDGLLVRLEGRLAAVEVEGETILAGGGASWAVCLHRARSAGLGGIEFACAIPGTVGGGVWMNAGAYGSDTRAVLRRALVVDADGACWRTPDELGLTYRNSELRHGQVVALAELALAKDDSGRVRQRVRELNAARKAAQPTNRRTFGSVFANPAHELTAGRMLDACGLRGHGIGGARISPKHANFIENAGNATSADALALIAEARGRAFERYGVVLVPEVELLGHLRLPSLPGEASLAAGVTERRGT